MTVVARRACWQAGWLVGCQAGSSDLWQPTHKSLFLSASVFGNKEESGGGEWQPGSQADIVFHICSCFAWKGDIACLFLIGGSQCLGV